MSELHKFIFDGMPVRARPDTVGYRSSKFVRRHRIAVAAAVLTTNSLGGAQIRAWMVPRSSAMRWTRSFPTSCSRLRITWCVDR